MTTSTTIPETIEIGQRIRFEPQNDAVWWTVRAADERFVIATRQAPFKPKGDLWYTVVDRTGWQAKRYNGAGEGVVRSSLNTLGGGWDIGPDGEGCQEALVALQSGQFELSNRRVMDVRGIEVAR